MSTTQEINRVPEEILSQLGGAAMLMAMIKVDFFVFDPKYLGIRFKAKSKMGNHIQITPSYKDLYNVKFWRITRNAMLCNELLSIDDVSVAELRKTIERETGLYLKF